MVQIAIEKAGYGYWVKGYTIQIYDPGLRAQFGEQATIEIVDGDQYYLSRGDWTYYLSREPMVWKRCDCTIDCLVLLPASDYIARACHTMFERITHITLDNHTTRRVNLNITPTPIRIS